MAHDHDAIEVPGAVVERLVQEAADAAPREACGLVVGDGRRIVGVVPAANIDPSPTRYTVAPEDHFAALRAASSVISR